MRKKIFDTNSFTKCAQNHIDQLAEEGRFSAREVFKYAIQSFAKFSGTDNVSFSQVTKESIKQYEQSLKDRGYSLNTVSTYLRMIRAVYNIGVDRGLAPYIPRLFRDVFTGVETKQKKALPAKDLQVLLSTPVESEKLKKTQAMAKLMFLFCGMPFVDLAHLQSRNLDSGILRYNRCKTGTLMTVEVLNVAQESFDILCNKDGTDGMSYLFPILSGQKDGEAEYEEYCQARHKFNDQLRELARFVGINSPISSYSIRHSYATSLKYNKVPIEMISELLGHKSIKTTQIYLKGFSLNERTRINQENYRHVIGNFSGSSQSPFVNNTFTY